MSTRAREIRQGGVRLLILLSASLLFATTTLAAPDEEALGKAEGYPICPSLVRAETRCLVGLVSHFDEIFPARKVARGARVRPLKRAAAEPAIQYTYQSRKAGLDDYLTRTRTTGLLILKDDTIFAERYQYDRTADHRMTSYSMAKTVVAMLVGVALSEGKIQSLDDRADKYVTELKGTAYGETPIRHLLSMSSGVKFTEVYSGSDNVATLTRLSLLGESAGGAATVMPFSTRERAPGEQFHYSSAETQVLGLVLRAATGKPLAEYLSEKIWQPLGAEATPPGTSTRAATRWHSWVSMPPCGTGRGSACCSRTMARSTAGRSFPLAGCVPRPHRRPSSSSRDGRTHSWVTATRPGSCPARSASSCYGDCADKPCSWIRQPNS